MHSLKRRLFVSFFFKVHLSRHALKTIKEKKKGGIFLLSYLVTVTTTRYLQILADRPLYSTHNLLLGTLVNLDQTALLKR